MEGAKKNKEMKKDVRKLKFTDHSGHHLRLLRYCSRFSFLFHIPPCDGPHTQQARELTCCLKDCDEDVLHFKVTRQREAIKIMDYEEREKEKKSK